MSKSGKSKRQLERLRQKRARRAAMKAQFEAWRDQGINQKSKRQRLKTARAAKPLRKHRKKTKAQPAIKHNGTVSLVVFRRLLKRA